MEGAEILGHVLMDMMKKAGTCESESWKSMDGITVPARRIGGIDDCINGSLCE